MAPPAHSSRTKTPSKGRKRQKRVPSSVDSESRSAGNKGKAEATDEFYSVRTILDENENEYLIDWNDNSQTGERYEPTWEPKSNANEAAITDWEEKRKSKKEGRLLGKKEAPQKIKIQKASRVVADSQSGPSTVETSQDSQPIRTTKRKRERAESPTPSDPTPEKRGIGRPRGSRNKRPRLQTGFSQRAQELELEVENSSAPVIENEVEDTYQEDPIVSSSYPVQVLIDQPETAVDLDEYCVISNPSSNETHTRSSREQPLASSAVNRDIVPDSQETPLSAEKSGSKDSAQLFVENSDCSHLSIKNSSNKSRAVSKLSVAEGEEGDVFEDPPSYRERAKYLDAEGSDNVLETSSLKVDGTTAARPQTPAVTPIKKLSIEPDNRLFQEQVGEPSSSGPGQVRSPNFEPIVISSQELTSSSSAPSPVNIWNAADDSELPIPVQIENDIDPDPVPPLIHTSESGDRESEETEDLQFQTQILYNNPSVNNSTQSSQEKPSSFETVISVARSSLDGDSEVESSEPWQGGQIVPEVDLLSSQSSLRQSLNFHLENETTANQHVDQEDSILPVNSSRRNTSLTQPSPRLDENHIFEPNHTSLLAGIDILASIEQDLPSPDFPPLHLVPSSGTPQLPETYGSNFPTRPSTPSNLSMEGDVTSAEQNEAPSPKLTITERLKQIRAQSAVHMSTRSPSAIPERVPTPPTAHPGQMLPSRQHHIEIEEPLPEVQHLAEVSPKNNEDTSEMQMHPNVPQIGKMEYLVPLPMVSFVRDVYAQTVKNAKTQIKLFAGESQIDSSTVEAIDIMIDDLKKCCTHQDLLSLPSATQAATPHKITAQWANTCSTKCMFLQQFLKETRNIETHVVILARPGRTMDILESILVEDKVSYERSGGNSSRHSTVHTPLNVTLHPTGEEGSIYVVARANLVIGFDDTYNSSEPYLHQIRADLYEDKLAPLVALIVVRSVEHLDRFIPQQMDPLVRKSVLVSCIAHTVREREMGTIRPEDPSPDHCATLVANYLAEGNPKWPLLPVPKPMAIDLYLEESTQHSSQEPAEAPPEQEASGSMTQSYDSGAHGELQVPQSSLKRSWDVDDEEGDSAKRLRATPQPEANDSSADATRISDSVVEASQLYATAAEHSTSFDDRTRQDNSFMNSPNTWQARISELEEQLRTRTVTELRLRAVNEQLRKDVSSHEKGVKMMQPKFQEALNERAAAVHEAKLAMEKVDNLTSRLETRNSEVAKLKEDNSKLQIELGIARQALVTSKIPEIADFEKIRAEARENLEEKLKAERRLQNRDKDFNFTKESYQKASSRVGELSSEVSELKEKNAILTRQADENKVIIARINNDQAIEFHVQRIKHLQIIIEDREEELAKKTEELRVLREGRRGTRGTSVPKSPMVNTGVLSPKVAGNRSRAGSPNVGDMGSAGSSGATRDTASFLSGGGGATGRFPPLSRLRE